MALSPGEGFGIKAAELGRNARNRLAWLTGGMLVMSLIIAAAALLLAFQGHGGSSEETGQPAAPAARSQTSDPAATDAARAFITLLDNQHWDQSWSVASSLFRSKLSSQQWASAVQPVRQPLGAVLSRTVESTSRTTSLPGAPPGDYDVVQFLTNFANEPGAVETVILTHEGAKWKVSGYFIR